MSEKCLHILIMVIISFLLYWHLTFKCLLTLLFKQNMTIPCTTIIYLTFGDRTSDTLGRKPSHHWTKLPSLDSRTCIWFDWTIFRLFVEQTLSRLHLIHLVLFNIFHSFNVTNTNSTKQGTCSHNKDHFNFVQPMVWILKNNQK